jgi:hypothetical protein
MLWFPALPPLRDDECRAFAQSVRPGAAFLEIEGEANRAYQAWLRDVLKRLVATHGTLELFVDARQMRAYETPRREQDAELLLRFGKRITRVHVLVRSRLMAVGVALADLMTLSGSVRAYAAPEKFDAAMAPQLERQVVGF